jgi:hypothetical protein
MTVVNVSQWQVNPGKAAAFMENVATAKAIHERLGASVRVYQASLAGPNAQSISYVIEHADHAAFGAFTDKQAADAEWQTFLVEVLGSADPTGVLVSNSLATEVTP